MGQQSLQEPGPEGRRGRIFRAGVRTLRLSDRQWRIYLAVWLVALAAVIGIATGLVAPKLLDRPRPQTLIGDIVMTPPVAAPAFTIVDQNGATTSLSQLNGRSVALPFP